MLSERDLSPYLSQTRKTDKKMQIEFRKSSFLGVFFFFLGEDRNNSFEGVFPF